MHKKANILGITLAVSLAGQMAINPANAAVTPGQLEASIKKANILAEGIGVKAEVKNELARISTFRNRKANDDDSKIEAVLIAKTIIDSAPEITRVMVYFYNSSDRTRYKEVDVTAGDVKAFGSGQVGQKELLSSITIKEGANYDASQVAGLIESAKMTGSSGGISVAVNGTDADVSAYLESENERDCRLEALRLAENTLSAQPGVQRVKVMFFSQAPDQKGIYRQIVFDANSIRTLYKGLDALLNPVQVTVAKMGAGSADLVAVAGPLQAERQGVLERLKELEKKGVGIAAYLNAFKDMESKVAAGDEAAIQAELKRVSGYVDEAEKKYKAAKDKQPTATASAAAGPSPAEGNPKYVQVLWYFSQVLREAGRDSEAKQFEARAQAVLARHPEVRQQRPPKLTGHLIGRGSPIRPNEVLLDPQGRLAEAEAALMGAPR